MFERSLYSEDHIRFGETVRQFIAAEIAPYHAQWERDGIVPRDVWRKAGAAGLLGCSVPEAYGGIGADELFNFMVVEEVGRSGYTGPGFSVHNEMVIPYLMAFGNEEQKRRWLPQMVAGEVIGALGLTEPHAGSDLRNIRTRAERDGDDYLISGQKVFISNGQLCDLIVLAAKTGDAEKGGITLFLVEAATEGFTRGRNLDKVGLRAQDTSELFFDNVRVPASSILGEEHGGFKLLMRNLAHERLTQAVRSAAVIEAALDWTIDYVRERRMFGKTVADFQTTQFKVAELKTEATIARVFVDACIRNFQTGKLDGTDAAMAKMWVSSLMGKVLDECLQMHGGWGYMWEYPIARAYADARVTRIAGGSIEVMKQIIGRSIFGARQRPRDD